MYPSRKREKFSSKSKKMPQLDKLVMLSQFFMLALFFLGLYFILLKEILPTILRINILRQNLTIAKISSSDSQESARSSEVISSYRVYNGLKLLTTEKEGSLATFDQGINVWPTYKNLVNNTLYKSKQSLELISAWVISKDVIGNLWSKEVNFYGLTSMGGSESSNLEGYAVSSKFIKTYK